MTVFRQDFHSFCDFLNSPADHPYYVGVQYHPEYLSRPIRPSPVFLGFILAGMGLRHACRCCACGRLFSMKHAWATYTV